MLMLEFYVLQSPITALLVLYSSTVQNNVKVKIIIIFKKKKKKTPATLTASARQPCRCSTTSGTLIAAAQQRP